MKVRANNFNTIKQLLNCAGIDNLLDVPDYKLTEMLIDYSDTRPLTDETLEELGFRKISITDDYYWDYNFGNDYFLISECKSERDEYYVVYFGYTGDYKYTTVGGIMMLIEALKGDE